MIFGIYDGHGGASCGIVTANRLHHYVAASLLSNDDLQCHLDNLRAAGTGWTTKIGTPLLYNYIAEGEPISVAHPYFF